ncbi:hypothetical protein I5Z76_05109 (plasmid) [Escherichia coli]|nr:hypothetical protein [Escherichia coli]MWN83251.1 hypothetical protein [Escherichia coli]MWP35271.1 hypothetical protein [Escherichia coli]
MVNYRFISLALTRYAGMTSVFNIARMAQQKRTAVLVAFVLVWETLALDDALDVLDAMLAVIIRDARKFPINIPAFMASLYREHLGIQSLCWKAFWSRKQD